jgi:hypothetical protein
VEFAGETESDRAEARRLYNELRRRGEEASRSRNPLTRNAGRSLVGMLDRAERSKKVYVIEGNDMDAYGGGIEYEDPSDPTRHFIRIDLDGSPGQKSAPWIILAHELGG